MSAFLDLFIPLSSVAGIVLLCIGLLNLKRPNKKNKLLIIVGSILVIVGLIPTIIGALQASQMPTQEVNK